MWDLCRMEGDGGRWREMREWEGEREHRKGIKDCESPVGGIEGGGSEGGGREGGGREWEGGRDHPNQYNR